MHDALTTRHRELADDLSLTVADRYRQLAAFHVATLDYRQAVQAMWASTVDMRGFTALSELSVLLRDQPAPLWLINSGEAVNYPRSEVVEWCDIEGLAQEHADISEMAISARVGSIHGAIAYLLFGRYGFAVQCLKASEAADEELSLESLAAMDMAVGPAPAWTDCWSRRQDPAANSRAS